MGLRLDRDPPIFFVAHMGEGFTYGHTVPYRGDCTYMALAQALDDLYSHGGWFNADGDLPSHEFLRMARRYLMYTGSK